MQREKSENVDNNWYALIVVMGGVFLSTMDSGMVNIALPTLMRHFSLTIGEAERVVTIYLLTITISLVFWGRLGDRFGLERIYIGGVLVFSFGSLLCYTVENFYLLLLYRAFQGLGAAMMMSAGPAIIKRSFAEELLGRSLGLVGVATACGLLSGPFICGQLLTYYNHSSIFLVSSILSALVAVFGTFFFYPNLLQPIRGNKNKFDWIGGLCWAAVVLLSINILQGFNSSPPTISIVKTIILLLLIIIFLQIERHVVNPILPVKSFLQRFYWVGVITIGLSFASLFSVLILLPFYLDYIRQMSSQQIGVMMMSVPTTLILLSPTAGYLYDKIGARFLTSFGLAISCVALFGISRLTSVSPSGLVVFLLATVGAGQSIFLSPNSASVLSKVAQDHLGTTAGILATARNLGMVTGATLATLLFSYFSSRGTITHPVNVDLLTEDQFLHAFSMTFRCMAGVTFTAALLSVLRR